MSVYHRSMSSALRNGSVVSMYQSSCKCAVWLRGVETSKVTALSGRLWQGTTGEY
jgi:hypothetical protein